MPRLSTGRKAPEAKISTMAFTGTSAAPPSARRRERPPAGSVACARRPRAERHYWAADHAVWGSGRHVGAASGRAATFRRARCAPARAAPPHAEMQPGRRESVKQGTLLDVEEGELSRNEEPAAPPVAEHGDAHGDAAEGSAASNGGWQRAEHPVGLPTYNGRTVTRSRWVKLLQDADERRDADDAPRVATLLSLARQLDFRPNPRLMMRLLRLRAHEARDGGGAGGGGADEEGDDGEQKDALVGTLAELRALGARPNVFVYNFVLARLGRRGEFDVMSRVLRDMANDDVANDTVTYNTMLKAVAQHQPVEHVQRVVAQMRQRGVFRSAVTYSIVIDALSRAGDLRGAVDAFDEMISLNVPLDPVVWSTMMHAYERRGLVTKVESLFREMRQVRLRPNAACLGILLRAYVCDSRLDEALQRMDDELSAGEIGVDAECVNVVLAALARRRDAAGALRVFSAAKARGVPLDVISYNTVVNAYARGGDVRAARQFVAAMERDGVAADLVTLRTLLKAHGRVLDVEGEAHVLSQIRARGVRVDLQMASSLVHTQLKMGALERAKQMFDEFVHASSITPDAYLYNKMMCGLADNGDVDGALRMWGRMQRDRVPPDRHTQKIVHSLTQRPPQGRPL